ncbi:hypothetical protein KR018_003457, partial [Drosophila ironensis]
LPVSVKSIVLCLMCGLLAAIADDFDGTTTTEIVEITEEPDDEKDYSLFVGELNLCRNVSDNVFLPYVGNCTKYYLCRSGMPIELQCEQPYQFNAPTQRCVSVGQADCLPQCDELSFSSYAYPRTCTKYVICYNGHPVLRECQDGLQYNSKTNQCDFPYKVDCVESECSVYNNAYHLRYVASKVSCEKYFLCANGVPKPQTCSVGLHFNSKCGCCDIPSNSGCQVGALPTLVSEAIAPNPPRESDLVCPSDGIHFFAHESRLDAYHFCAEGRGLIMECSHGLRFDPKVKECREPQNMGL